MTLLQRLCHALLFPVYWVLLQLFPVRMQEDWQMRRQAVETFITLAAAVQVSSSSAAAQQQLMCQ